MPFKGNHLESVFVPFEGLTLSFPLNVVWVYELSGSLRIRASSTPTAQNWRSEAQDLLRLLNTALGFVNGGVLKIPVVEYYEGSNLEVNFRRVGSAGISELSIQSHLNLQPFFRRLVDRYPNIIGHRDTLEMAIGWFLIDTSYNEIRFLTAMTAIEYLVSHAVPRQVMRTYRDRHANAIRRFFSFFIPLRWTLRGGIDVLLTHLNINRNDISESDIGRMVSIRNEIIHRGGVRGNDDLWDQVILAREIIARVVLTLLEFEGNYDCFIGGSHMRHFPSGNRIT